MLKILTFAWKQVHRVYTDIPLLLFMLITPLAIATIIGLAFWGNSGTLSIADIPIAVVNLDEGAAGNNYGDTIASILLSTVGENTESTNSCSLVEVSGEANEPPQTLDSLLAAEVLTEPSLARAGVDEGRFVAAIIIPANFTETLAPSTNFTNLPNADEPLVVEPVSIEIYVSPASPISASIVRSITESITNQMTRGSVTINATIRSLLMNPRNVAPMLQADDSDFADFSCAFMSELSPIKLVRQPLGEVQEQSPFVQILVAMGSAQAVFFAIFTMNSSLLSIYSDKQTWILQRLLISPTPRVYIIVGKILGAILLVFMQVGLLLIFLTLVASMVMGEPLFIWGTNIPLLFLHTLAVGIAVAGLGIFVVGLANNAEQAQIFGTLAAMAMAILGGAFGFDLEAFGQFSIIHWGVRGYASLSAGSNDISLNMLVLFVAGGILFAIGAVLFNKRAEV